VSATGPAAAIAAAAGEGTLTMPGSWAGAPARTGRQVAPVRPARPENPVGPANKEQVK